MRPLEFFGRVLDYTDAEKTELLKEAGWFRVEEQVIRELTFISMDKTWCYKNTPFEDYENYDIYSKKNIIPNDYQ